jgi:hypothetical protein
VILDLEVMPVQVVKQTKIQKCSLPICGKAKAAKYTEIERKFTHKNVAKRMTSNNG